MDTRRGIKPYYPERYTVWRGAILHAIVNATMIAQCPGYSRYLFCDNNNYVLNNADGTYGTIAFDGPEGPLVAVFFDARSKFNPIGSESVYDIDVFFRGMSPRHRRMVEDRALQYNRQIYRGEAIALVTAAFWDDGGFVTSACPWNEVLLNGAHIIKTELLELELAMMEWQDAYQMSYEQANFARLLFERRMTEPVKGFELSHYEISWLAGKSKDSEAMEDCRQAFEAIGIHMS